MTIAIVSAVIFIIALAGGTWLAGHNARDQQRSTKILLFVLYFWVLVFVQLIVAAIAYALMGR